MRRRKDDWEEEEEEEERYDDGRSYSTDRAPYRGRQGNAEQYRDIRGGYSEDRRREPMHRHPDSSNQHWQQQQEPHHRHYHQAASQTGSIPRATLLEIESKDARTLRKNAPSEESVRDRGDSVVMCRYNPTHILDMVNIDMHQEHCKDRMVFEEFGISF